MMNQLLQNLWLDQAWAMAQPPEGSEGGGFMSSLPILVLMIGIMYFLVIRPQKKQADDQKKFIAGLNKGDEVITSGGIYGKIVGLADQAITLEIAGNVKIKVLKSHVHKLPAAPATPTQSAPKVAVNDK